MRVDFSKMPEYNLMDQIRSIEHYIAYNMAHERADMATESATREQDQMIEELRGMIDEEAMQHFLLSLMGPAIILMERSKING